MCVRIKAGSSDKDVDPRASAKAVNKEIIDANRGMMHHQTSGDCAPGILVEGLKVDGYQPKANQLGKRGVIMFATSHCTDKRIEPVNPSTDKG